MQCPNCNEQVQTAVDSCPHCGHKLAVTVLSHQERDNFNGITIEDGTADDSRRQYSSYEFEGAPRVRRINISFGSYGWAGKLMAAAILAIVLFFFLPLLMFILLVIGGAAIIGVWLLRMLRK